MNSEEIKILKQQIKTMQAFLDGEEIEVKFLNPFGAIWVGVSDPVWDWANNSYRVKVSAPTYVGWGNLPRKYKYVTVDEDGTIRAHTKKPYATMGGFWSSPDLPTNSIYGKFSLNGNTWDKSLVTCPELI